jgi:hypothetical protein
MQIAPPMSNLQQELLKLYAANIADEDLLHIKAYLAQYFAAKAIADADRIWDEKGYSNETMKSWLNEEESKYGKDSH